ncbi:MAG: DUF354 domain-containing protein [Cryomorphaceae bacterium]|nr:DUF354 domain-containing protein [Cryomorphaceae bacterium]
MRFLIDIGHPAHVHLFKFFALDMMKKGHEFLFTCRQKEFEIELLEAHNLPYVSFGPKYSGLVGKVWGMFKFGYKEYKTAKKFKPDFFLSHGSIYAAHAAFFLGKPHIAMEDTFNFEQIRLYLPFTKYVLTSDYMHPLSSHRKNISYPGYHELCYLHPNRFKAEPSIFSKLGLKENDKYVLIRFVSWNATHDAGHTGMSFENKLKAIELFKKYGKVFISSEKKLPEELEKYRLPSRPEDIHHVIAHTQLLFGESSTMSEEAAMLGVPSVYMFNNSTLYTKHLEDDYGLMFNFSESDSDQNKAIEKAQELLENPSLKSEWEVRKMKMLSERCDVTNYLTWFFENYPKSAEGKISFS